MSEQLKTVSLKIEPLQYIAIYYNGSIFNETDFRNHICYNQLFHLQQNLDELTDTAIPVDIRLNRAMDLEQPYSKFLS